MSQLCDLQVLVNGQHTFFLNEEVVSAYSAKLRKMITQAKKKKKSSSYDAGEVPVIVIADFPGGSDGFELFSRFCHNKGQIEITASNASLLHCAASFLDLSSELSGSSSNLLEQTEQFLEGMFHWSWSEILAALRSCEPLFDSADSYGLIDKLICAVLAKIAQNSDLNFFLPSCSSSSSSPETSRGFRLSSSAKNTPEWAKPSSSSPFSCGASKELWWFQDLAKLSPRTIGRLIRNLGAYGVENNSLILTKFLLHFLKTQTQNKSKKTAPLQESGIDGQCGGLADTAIHGVIYTAKTSFSCRKLFWVLRVVSRFNLSTDSRAGLERLIGENLDQASLDDLLVSGRCQKGVYDVDLVIKLLRGFVKFREAEDEDSSGERLKRVGRLMDKYLGEISPDPNLKASKFIGVALSLPDSARECFDGVYRAIDIYLESHPNMTVEERSKLCGCLNYKKLTLETCKELAKNPKIPPNVAVQALKSQQTSVPKCDEYTYETPTTTKKYSYDHHHHHHHHPHSRRRWPQRHQQAVTKVAVEEDSYWEDGSEDIKMNLRRMQYRVVELEKICKEMKGQMSRLSRHSMGSPSRPAPPRLC